MKPTSFKSTAIVYDFLNAEGHKMFEISLSDCVVLVADIAEVKRIRELIIKKYKKMEYKNYILTPKYFKEPGKSYLIVEKSKLEASYKDINYQVIDMNEVESSSGLQEFIELKSKEPIKIVKAIKPVKARKAKSCDHEKSILYKIPKALFEQELANIPKLDNFGIFIDIRDMLVKKHDVMSKQYKKGNSPAPYTLTTFYSSTANDSFACLVVNISEVKKLYPNISIKEMPAKDSDDNNIAEFYRYMEDASLMSTTKKCLQETIINSINSARTIQKNRQELPPVAVVERTKSEDRMRIAFLLDENGIFSAPPVTTNEKSGEQTKTLINSTNMVGFLDEQLKDLLNKREHDDTNADLENTKKPKLN